MHVLFFRPPKGNRESHFAHDARFADTHFIFDYICMPWLCFKIKFDKVYCTNLTTYI